MNLTLWSREGVAAETEQQALLVGLKLIWPRHEHGVFKQDVSILRSQIGMININDLHACVYGPACLPTYCTEYFLAVTFRVKG